MTVGDLTTEEDLTAVEDLMAVEEDFSKQGVLGIFIQVRGIT
jgi:hypothetical protein